MPEKQEDQFLQRRLLLASVLSAVALTVYVYLAPKPQPQAPTAGQTTEQAAPPQAAETPQTSTNAPASAGTESQSGETAPSQIAAEAEQRITLETDTYAIAFSNRGAVVTSWTLKHYNDAKGERLDLVYGPGAEKYSYPFSLERPGGEPFADINKALFVSRREPPGESLPATLVFEYGDEARTARKSFHFQKDGYLLRVETELTENGRPQQHLLTWNSGFGDTDQLQDYLHSTTFYYDPVARKLARNKAADAEKTRIVNDGPFPFAGIDDLFFTATFLPARPEAPLKLESAAVQITKAEGATPEVYAALGASSDGEGKNDLQVFVGPKSIDNLRSVLPEMGQIVDFGFFSFVAEPLFWMLRWTHEHVVANWGWSIVVLTVFINFALFPLKWKSMKSMKKMQALQPLVKQINEKYKGLSMRDPKKAQQNEELMGLYKKHGVNPMGGCLPMLLQLPFFIGFYNVLFVAIEMRHASWLWVSDLSTFEALPIRVLPLAMVATQFWQQSLTPTPTADPAQMRLMKFMPLMMGFIFYSFSAGLVLFWLTGNIIGIAQQLILNRFASDEPVLDDKLRGRKKKAKTG
jgi:YidC/Oxa1 family membrane protein insertase